MIMVESLPEKRLPNKIKFQTGHIYKRKSMLLLMTHNIDLRNQIFLVLQSGIFYTNSIRTYEFIRVLYKNRILTIDVTEATDAQYVKIDDLINNEIT